MNRPLADLITTESDRRLSDTCMCLQSRKQLRPITSALAPQSSATRVGRCDSSPGLVPRLRPWAQFPVCRQTVWGNLAGGVYTNVVGVLYSCMVALATATRYHGYSRCCRHVVTQMVTSVSRWARTARVMHRRNSWTKTQKSTDLEGLSSIEAAPHDSVYFDTYMCYFAPVTPGKMGR